jgi:small GTP-binding protein
MCAVYLDSSTTDNVSMILAKVCVLGDVSVGKTSVIRRFVDREFSDKYLSTVGVKISRKLVRIPGAPGQPHLEIQLVLWDLEGGNTFGSISSTYLKGARAAVVVADITRSATLDAIPTHIERFRTANPSSLVFVALNKSDLQENGIPHAYINREAQTGVAITLLTSARTGIGIDDLFESIGLHLSQGMVNESASG